MKKNSKYEIDDWDWGVDKKTFNINSWKQSSCYIEEIQSSSDGEHLAVIAKNKDGQFQIYDTKKLWKNSFFDKIWNLSFTKNGTLFAFVLTEEGWTVSIDGSFWNNAFDYIWSSLHDCYNGSCSIAAAVKKDMKYSMILNGKTWSKSFESIGYCTLNSEGTKTAAVVQTEHLNSGEIKKFKEKLYTVALEGEPWATNFLNVWNPSISSNGRSVVAEVRLDLNNYTIAVDGIPWSNTYNCVWEPVFHPKETTVVAPVRIGNRWGMAANGTLIWKAKFDQLWHQSYNSDGTKLAAIVSPHYGRWTVAIDENPWRTTVDTMITDLTFSADGNHVSALAKHKDSWFLILDDIMWNHKFDMIWPPVFSIDGNNIAAKVEIDGKYTFAVNNFLYKDFFDTVWNPEFNKNGDRILMRTIKDNVYERRVVKVSSIE